MRISQRCIDPRPICTVFVRFQPPNLICAHLGYPFNRSSPAPLFSTGGSLEAAPNSAGARAPAAALAGLSEVDGWL